MRLTFYSKGLREEINSNQHCIISFHLYTWLCNFSCQRRRIVLNVTPSHSNNRFHQHNQLPQPRGKPKRVFPLMKLEGCLHFTTLLVSDASHQHTHEPQKKVKSPPNRKMRFYGKCYSIAKLNHYQIAKLSTSPIRSIYLIALRVDLTNYLIVAILIRLLKVSQIVVGWAHFMNTS